MNGLRFFATIPPIVTRVMSSLSGRSRVADRRVARPLQILFEDEAAAMACFEIRVRRPPRNVRAMRQMTHRWSSCPFGMRGLLGLYNLSPDTRA